MKKLYMALLAGLILSVGSCDEEEKFSLTPSLGFMETEGTIGQDESVDIEFYSNVALTEPVTIQVQVSSISDLVYEDAYVTDPEPVDGIITVTTDPETGKGKFRVRTFETGETEITKLNFVITSVNGGDVQPAQSVALNYALSIKGFRNVTPVDLKYDFNTDLSAFNERIPASAGIPAAIWTSSSFGYPTETTKCAEANAYSKTGSGESNHYLVIGSALPASDYTVKAMVYSRYAGAGTIKFRYTTDYSGTGDPEAAGITWTDITSMNNNLPAGGSQVWKEITGKIENPSEKVAYLAIEYVGAKVGNASLWRVDDLSISNKK
jgi:hypothetical protein